MRARHAPPFCLPPRARRGGARRALGACLLLPVLLLTLALPADLGAEEGTSADEGDVRARVARWLEDLRSPAFEVREAARQGLETYGEKAVDLLQAAREDPDPEVRRTVRLLLERLGAPPPEEAPPAGDLGAQGLVTLRAEGPASEVLAALAAPYGLRFEHPEDAPDPPVRLAVESVPFYEALARVTDAAGLVAREPFDAGGTTRLAAADGAGDVPWAAAGPTRLRVVEVTSVRTLGPKPRRRHVLTLELHWLPTVQLVTYRVPDGLEGQDAEGHAYQAASTMRSSTIYGVSTSARSARLSLHLEPEEEDAAGSRLVELAFALGLRLRHDRQEVRFADLPSLTLPATEGEAADKVTLRSVGRPDGERGPWVLDLVADLSGETARKSLVAFLERADGTVQPALSGSRFPSADGSVAWSARVYGRWEEPPVGVRVAWYRAEEEGELAYTLRDVPLR